MRKIAFLLVALVGTAALAQGQTTWELDKTHTNIGFTAIHYVITEVEGEFREFDGSVVSQGDDFDGATVTFSAKIASIDTDNERRDGHLKSDDFFNAEKFPELTFSGQIQKEGDAYYLVGDFTMRDVTKAVKFDVKFNGIADLGERGKKAGFKITGTVNRFDYGLKYDDLIETGGLAVSKEIELTCNVELNESEGS